MYLRQSMLGLASWLLVNIVFAQWSTPVEQMEQLDRGIVVVPGQSGGRFVNWRLLGTDNPGITFDVVTPSAFNMRAADVDNDSEVSIADAIAVVNIILSNSAGS